MKYILRTPNDIAKVTAILSGIPLDKDNLMQLELSPYKPVHNREQENLWHAMLGDLAREFNKKNLGYSQDDVKSIVKYKLGLYKELAGKTETIVSYENTHGRSKTFYIDLIEQTYHLAAEWGIILP